jgi:hypothetical protein
MARSMPDVKWAPRPLITGMRTSAIWSILLKADRMSCHICWVIGLALSGRFNSTAATPFGHS